MAVNLTLRIYEQINVSVGRAETTQRTPAEIVKYDLVQAQTILLTDLIAFTTMGFQRKDDRSDSLKL